MKAVNLAAVLFVTVVVIAVCEAQVSNTNTKQTKRRGENQREGAECDLNVAKGTCNNTTRRFFYNKTSGKCERFQYSGCGGNLNNFNSLDLCYSRCICSRKLEKGAGSQNLERFYYNTGAKECKKFTYKGRNGNTNNFKSMSACNSRCVASQGNNKCKSRPSYGNGCNRVADSTEYYYDNFCDCCRPFRYSGCGGNGNRFPSRRVCKKECSKSKSTTTTVAPSSTTTLKPVPTLCFKQPAKGLCGQDISRFYYDATSNTCKTFSYSGCGGNGNNFIFRSDCEGICQPTTTTTTTTVKPTPTTTQIPAPALCFHQPAKGPCGQDISRFYYNVTSNTCNTFSFSGCGGNGNNFIYRSECKEICQRDSVITTTTTTTTLPPTTTTVKPGGPGRCELSPQVGDCDDIIIRYYYDRETRGCRLFLYSGCGGNDNNFLTPSQCMEACFR